MMVRGKVRGLSNYYCDGVERQEIWIAVSQAKGLPCVANQRTKITLVVDGEPYKAGLSATDANKYVWINPDLYRNSEKIRLADVLRQVGIVKNEEVELRINGLQIEIDRPLT